MAKIILSATAIFLVTVVAEIAEFSKLAEVNFTDPFVNAGIQKGLEIWRIKDCEPVLIPRNEIGTFYSGDAYIVLNTKENANHNKSWDIHFWIGNKSTRDEGASASINTIALDSKLGNSSVQYKEIEGMESPLFLSYFKPKGITYLEGGNTCSFVSDNNRNLKPPKMTLYQIKGNINPTVRLVEPSITSMNKGDCFILDDFTDDIEIKYRNILYIYCGPDSNRVENLKAASIADRIAVEDHNTRAKIFDVGNMTEIDKRRFFVSLGAKRELNIADKFSGNDDEKFERTFFDQVKLYQISDESGTLIANLVKKPYSKQSLNQKNCYILETSTSYLYVWTGKKCNITKRRETYSQAQQFFRLKKYPNWVRLVIVGQETETTDFKEYFGKWDN